MPVSKEIVEVFNNDHEPYEEVYKEERIFIPAHKSIKMKRRKAVGFLGKIPPNNKDGTMRKKRLVIKRPGETMRAGLMPEIQEEEYVCHLDGMAFKTQMELDNHLEKFKGQTVKSTTLKVCPICDMELDNQDILMEHLSVHREKTTAPNVKVTEVDKPVKFGKKGK